jgi:hypothetical protein
MGRLGEKDGMQPYYQSRGYRIVVSAWRLLLCGGWWWMMGVAVEETTTSNIAKTAVRWVITSRMKIHTFVK